MNRAVDIPTDPQVRARKVFTDMTHRLFESPLLTETGPAPPFIDIPPAELRPAPPTAGEHTREICRELLGMPGDETERLIACGALFADDERT